MGKPAVSRRHKGYIDAGGTYTRIGIYDRSNMYTYTKVFQAADYRGLHEILDEAFLEAGLVPEHMLFALAGPYSADLGTMRFTDLPSWPGFVRAETEQRYGCRIVLRNDVEVLAAGAATTSTEHLTVLRPGIASPKGRVVVVTLSTGFGAAIAQDSHTFATECGCEGAVPITDDERDFANYTATALGKPYALIGYLLDGGGGYQNAYNWLIAKGMRPAKATQVEIDKLAQSKLSIAPAITAHIGHDPFVGRLIRTMGGLYGTYLRQLMNMLQPNGGMHLVGGVNLHVAELFADPARSPLMARLNDRTVEYSEETARFVVAINHDAKLAQRGAQVILNQK